MGTPDFAVFSLSPLVDAGENVVAVITQPDKPKGRGYVLTPPPVKEYALAHNLPVYQPNTLRDEAFAELLKELNPDLILVTAYGKILPANVLSYPKYGCINIHGSLLPKYRGAAPMQRAIIDGEKEIGITVMRMDIGMDTGNMLFKKSCPIEENDNFETIHDKMGALSMSAIPELLEKIRNNTLVDEVQDNSLATYADKIEKEDCLLDFSKTAWEVHNQIRGLSPFPLSFTYLPNGQLLKVVKAQRVEMATSGKVGEVVSLKGGIVVACKDFCVALLEILPEGKKKMGYADFVNGRKIAVGDVLGEQQ